MKKLFILMVVMCMLLNSAALVSCVAAEYDATEEQSAYMTSINWIWNSSELKENIISYFRHDYDLKSEPVSMKVRVSAHNHLKFYVNCNIVTGYVSPAPASLPNNIYYLEYDFSGKKLERLLGDEPTKLALAAAVQYMGRGGMNYINGRPAFWAEITLEYADDTSETLVSDTTWRTLINTPYANSTPKMSGRGMNMQIDYDAQKMSDALEWTLYGYDESSYTHDEWENAVAAHSDTQSYKMRRQTLPEGVIHKSIVPTAANKQDVGYQVFDAGRVVSGFVRFSLSAPAGTQVYIRYGERLNGDGTVFQSTADEGTADYRDFYTFSGNGTEEFVADFDYKAFRYFELVGMPELVNADDLTVEWASTGVEHTASFDSSSTVLNKIYEACINTQINNILGMPVDCPHREQAQYIADAQIQYDLLSYAFSNMKELSYKTLLDFACQQFDNGIFSFVAPSAAYAGLNSLHIPEWDLRYSDILLTYYNTTGDLTGTIEFYDNAAANVAYWEQGIDSTGLVRMDYGVALWHIADHPSPQVVTSNTNYSTVNNLLLFDSYRDLEKIATILGKDDDAKAYKAKGDNLLDAINANCLDRESGLYIDSVGNTNTNPGVSAMAINVGATPDYLIPAQIDYIASSPIKTNVVLTWEVMNALLNYGDADAKEACYDMILEIYTKMGESGTVWESVWNTNASHSHAWNAFPAKMLHRYYLGVEYAGVNYTDVEIRPYLPEELDYMYGTLEIPGDRGTVDVQLIRDGEALKVAVDTAETALVGVPRVKNASTLVKLSSEEVFTGGQGKSLEGVTYAGNDSEYVYFNVEAGNYLFTSEAEANAEEGEFDVKITATEGGLVSVNGAAAVSEYTAKLSAGESISVVATPDLGYKFTGFTGTYGSRDNSFTLTVGGNVDVVANFEKSDTVKRYIHINAPDDKSFSVIVDGERYDLPASVPTDASKSATIIIDEKNDRNYDFVAFTGDIYNANTAIRFDAGLDDISLDVIGSFKGLVQESTDTETGEPVNIALGASVESANTYTEKPKWQVSNLTDGKKLKDEVKTGNYFGLTSNAYKTQDISETPHTVIIDLGSDKYMDTAVIWPRSDNVNAGAENDCFPESYTVSVMADGGSEYTEVASVTDGGNPCGEGVTVEFDKTVCARFVKFTFTKLGKGTVESGSTLYRVQLAEIELFMNGEIPEGDELKSLNVTGKGKILVNGEEKVLPFNASYTAGTRLAIQPVAEKGVDFVSFGGDIKTNASPLYLTMDNDINIVANYSQNVISVSDNLLSGKIVTIPSSAVTLSGTTWALANLTDGNKGGNGGFTSAGYSKPEITDTNLYLEFDLGANTDFSRIVMYPRLNCNSTLGNGTTSNFPEAFNVEYKLDGSSAWITVAQFTDIPNPKGQPVAFDFDYTNARYIRIRPTKIGAPAADAYWEYRMQLAELELYATNLMDENIASNATISADTKLEVSGAWSVAYLTDGVTAYKSGTSRGYTSDSLKTENVKTNPHKIEFTFAEAVKLNEMILYPRTDAKDANGETPNFPTAYYIEAYNSTLGQYEKVYEVNGLENPKFMPVYNIFDKDVTTTKVRLCVTGLGSQPTDEPLYRLQFAEIKLGYVEAIVDSFAKNPTVALDPSNTITIADKDASVSVSSSVTGVSGDKSALVFSVEDEKGFPVDFLKLSDITDSSVKLSASKEGTAYVVARLENLPQIVAKTAVNSTIVVTVLYGDVDTDGSVNPIDLVTLSRFVALWSGYDASVINEDNSDVNTDESVDSVDTVILARHLADWTGYKYLPFMV